MKWSAKIIGNDLAERKIIANFVVPNLERSGLLKNLFLQGLQTKNNSKQNRQLWQKNGFAQFADM